MTEQTCLFLVLIIITLCSFFASCSTFSEGFYTKWFSMCVFTVINEDNDPSKIRELLLGGLFLFISENIHSSPAFLCNFKKSSRIVCQPSAHAHRGIKNTWIPTVAHQTKQRRQTSDSKHACQYLMSYQLRGNNTIRTIGSKDTPDRCLRKDRWNVKSLT